MCSFGETKDKIFHVHSEITITFHFVKQTGIVYISIKSWRLQENAESIMLPLLSLYILIKVTLQIEQLNL